LAQATKYRNTFSKHHNDEEAQKNADGTMKATSISV
jgi:hypothetical protein